MGELRRFKKEDWYAWGGAERFENGSDPFIHERELNDGEVDLIVIADATGIQITLEGQEETMSWVMCKSLTSIKAEGEMRHIIMELEKYTYAPDLSYSLDHDAVFNKFVYVG